MKRRYKNGDWFRVPLGGEHDAVGVIARMCRSRLFGYFFPVEAGRHLGADDLKALRAQGAVACALFGGAGIEEARWRVIATSLPFDPTAWPVPPFASRGVFGRTWSAIAYDPETMSIASRAAITSEQAAHLPDARFATPEELESLLRLRIAGETPEVPLSVYEVRSPVDASSLQLLARGGRVQFSEMLAESDLDALAAFIAAHPGVELRVHSIVDFDLRTLVRFGQLRSLLLDVPSAIHAEALAHLRLLESFKRGRADRGFALDALVELPQLHRLELHGANADVRVAQALPRLDSLTLYATPAIRLERMQSAPRLRTLVLSHVPTDVAAVASLPALERVSLRGMDIPSLPDLSRNAHLDAIELRDVTALRDLTPLATAPSLRELRIEGMPHLQMSDFEPLTRSAHLRDVSIEIGSKSKTREIYRMLRGARR